MHNNFNDLFSHIEPDSALKNRIIERMENNEMKKTTRISIGSIAAAAACIAIMGISTVFAAGNIISYFQSEKAIELTNMEALSQYNEEVGATSSNSGYTLTLDNLATDDNFMHIFYTLKKDDAPMTKEDFYGFWFLCRINGKLANFSNHNQYSAYQTEDGSYKGVLKLNIADMDIPETFTLEMYSETSIKENSKFEGNYLYKDNLRLTDEDKSKLLYISTTAKKSSVETASVVKDVKQKFPVSYFVEKDNGEYEEKQGEAEISKVVFSPFGSQLVVKDRCEGNGGSKISGCAIFDENGQSLDVLNTDLTGGRVGVETINKIEFLKADANTKSLKIVPVKEYSDDSVITHRIGTYPLTYKVNQYGSIVVTDIRFSDGEFEIDYYKDGFSMFDPFLDLTDKDGNDYDAGVKLGCLLDIIVHHDTNSYTAKYSYYDEYDESGNLIPVNEGSVSKEKLEKAFTHLSISAYELELDYDNAIDIDLR